MVRRAMPPYLLGLRLVASGSTDALREHSRDWSENGHRSVAVAHLIVLVARDGVEPPTHGFSVRCSTN